MGLGSDSIVLASAGHRVTALESSKLVHFIVSRGLQDFDSGSRGQSSHEIYPDNLDR